MVQAKVNEALGVALEKGNPKHFSLSLESITLSCLPEEIPEKTIKNLNGDRLRRGITKLN